MLQRSPKSLLLALILGAMLGACGDDGGDPTDACRLPEYVPGPLDYRTCECGEWKDACYYRDGYLCAFTAKGTACVKRCSADDECPPYEGFKAECRSRTCTVPCDSGCPGGMVCDDEIGCVWERER